MASFAKTVLVVDDEPDVRTTLQELLEREGHKVITAVDGDDGLKKLSKQKVDLILLDVMMPGTPVKDIIKRIKDTKIMYVTVVRTSEAEKEQLLREKNIVGFIQKPFDINDFLNSVKKVLH